MSGEVEFKEVKQEDFPGLLLEMKPNHSIAFYHKNRVVGALDWNEGKLIFTGDIDHSARVFFGILKGHIDAYLKEQR